MPMVDSSDYQLGSQDHFDVDGFRADEDGNRVDDEPHLHVEPDRVKTLQMNEGLWILVFS